MARPAPGGHTLESWLQQLWSHRGTDLLLTAGAPPLIRVEGMLVPIESAPVLTPDAVVKAIDEALARAGRGGQERTSDVDFSFDWSQNARLRGNVFRQRGSDALALRMVPYEIPGFDALGIPHVVRDMVRAPQGLVLVTGPTGSGKSTTLASMIDTVNRERACHILTIEDPIEYVYGHKTSAVNQREVGIDTPSFASALRSALREDPDVLLVGEMRDTESIATALTIAETGHLVFATLHTNDTAQAIDRIVDVFPAERRTQIQVQLSATLQGVVYQRLVPRLAGGLVAAFEVLVATAPVRNLIREGKTAQLRNVIATHRAEGMRTLEADLTRLVTEGVVDRDEAAALSLHPTEIGRRGDTALGETTNGRRPPGSLLGRVRKA